MLALGCAAAHVVTMKKPLPARPAPAPKFEGPLTDAALLPPRVAAMREKILEACESATLEALRPAIERNETLPLFGERGTRPASFATALEFLAARSYDGKGVETLRLLQAILEAPFVKAMHGVHVSWVWPSYGLAKGKEADAADEKLSRWRCVSFADALAARAQQNSVSAEDGSQSADPVSPRLHRVTIGDDGTWHAFEAG